jgi:hypothetical protein
MTGECPRIKKRKRPPKLLLEASEPRPKPVAWASGSAILEQARQYPLLECWIDRDWEETDLARVVIARQQADERVLFGLYLVDRYCLRTTTLNLGRTANHFFVAGPYDNPRWVIGKLIETAGEGNFDYLIPMGGPPDF